MRLRTALLAGILALAAAVPALSTPAPGRALGPCDVPDTALDAEEQAFLQLLNDYRAASGLQPVAVDTALVRAATWMSIDLSSRAQFDHTDSLGRSPWARMADCGVARPGGENIAAGGPLATAAAVFAAWKGSPGHDAIMRDPAFTLVGVARHVAPGSQYGVYWTLTFGYGSPAAAPAPRTPSPTPTPPAPTPTPVPPPPPPPPSQAHEARTFSVGTGATTFTWNGPATPVAGLFQGAGPALRGLYAYDPASGRWLRWSPRLHPRLNTLAMLEPGVRYWVVAGAPFTISLP